MDPIEFRDGVVEGVIWKPLKRFEDGRGWLCELFRDDELPAGFRPVMSYLSMTHPGVARGPHEHIEQSDYFCFLGPSTFKLYLWDNRPDSPTYRVKQTELAGVDRPMMVIIPPGVAHAYRNVGSEPGLVINCPDRLYRGPGRSEPVDEIRHEDDPDTPYRLD
jgi:dTDP-4-dehydrorhamnose 3,5-epimerase